MTVDDAREDGAGDDGAADDARDGGSANDASATDDGGSAATMVLTERSTEEGLLVSICDDDVLGESFEEGEISLTVTEEFYGGETVDDEVALASLRRATVANLVGERTVHMAIEAGIVEEENVLDVGETRHAQVLSVR